MDHTDNRWGVQYPNRKAPLEEQQLGPSATGGARRLLACQRLEGEPQLAGKLLFGGQEMEFFVNDRLLAPNRPATPENGRGPILTRFSPAVSRRRVFAFTQGRSPPAVRRIREDRPGLLHRRSAGNLDA